jgi:hypothetical protein
MTQIFDKDLSFISHHEGNANGKNAKATWKKTYLRRSLNLAKTCHTQSPGIKALK